MEELRQRIKATEFRASFLSDALAIIDKHTLLIRAKRAGFVKEALAEVMQLTEAIVTRDVSAIGRREASQALEAMQRWMDSKISDLDSSLKLAATEANERLSTLDTNHTIVTLQREILIYEKTIERLTPCWEMLKQQQMELETKKVKLMMKAAALRKVVRKLGVENFALLSRLSPSPVSIPVVRQPGTPKPAPVPMPDLSKWHIPLHMAKRSLHSLRRTVRRERQHRSEALHISSEIESLFLDCMNSLTSRLSRRSITPVRTVYLRQRKHSTRSHSLARAVFSPKSPHGATQCSPLRLIGKTDLAVLLAGDASLRRTLLQATIRSRSRNASFETSPSP